MFACCVVLLAAVAAAPVESATNSTDVCAATNKVAAMKAPSRQARITASTTYYDRKEGVAVFTGGVYVDDERYQLHADKAYVFVNGTNELERIVAVGNIAMTNETKRAYGAKAAYYRSRGMVVLHAGDGRPAEVRDVKPDGDQVVRGKKIKFWVDSEQVEVVDAEITAPARIDSSGLKSFR